MYRAILSLSNEFVKQAQATEATVPGGKVRSTFEEYTPDYIKDVAARKFNIQTLKDLTNYQMAFDYAKMTLSVVSGGRGSGVGSGRIAYDLGNNVLKFAHNDNGIAQNFMEARIQNHSDLLTDVFDMHPKAWWIISEKVKPFNSWDQFSLLTGVPKELLINAEETRAILDKVTPDDLDKMRARYDLDNDSLKFVNDLSNLKHKLDLLSGDTFNPTHWGINSEGKIKLFDYGFDKYTFDHVYKEPNNPSESEEQAMMDMFGSSDEISDEHAALGVHFASLLRQFEKIAQTNIPNVSWARELESIINSSIKKYNKDLSAEISIVDPKSPITIEILGTNMGNDPVNRNNIRENIQDIVANSINYFDKTSKYSQKIGTSWVLRIK
jgi:hypothetical protein